MGPSKRRVDPLAIADALSGRLAKLRFGEPVTHVYNPHVYARAPYAEYVRHYGARPKEVLLLGMNPGPFGMAQTGVPFGEVSLVHDWMGIDGIVAKPKREHPKRPVAGFECHRSEVSGARLWGWARQRFVTPARFFARFFIINYCPLVFMEESGRNRTPDKLPPHEREPLFAACDEALVQLWEYFQPRYVVGVGVFAQGRAKEALAGRGVRIGRILHPSPASPAANNGWVAAMEGQLVQLGIRL